MKRVAIAIAVLTLWLAKAEAQSDTTRARVLTDSTLTSVLADTTSLLGVRRSKLDPVRSQRFSVTAIRSTSASVGFMFGAVLGGFVGHELNPPKCDNCRKETGEALLTGAAIGGTVGAALGTAFLDVHSVCRFDKRLTRTMLGSLVGASAVFVASGGLKERRGGSAFFIPFGAIGGSLGALGGCWRSGF